MTTASESGVPEPLAAALARVATLDPHSFAADLGALEPGWFLAMALCDADSSRLAEGLAHCIRRYPGADRRVAGAFLIGQYAWYVAGAAVGCYLAERRAPDLAPENVALRYTTYTWRQGDQSGEAEAIAVRFVSGRFAALLDDPVAAHPDAHVLPCLSALRDWLRQGLERHLAPLIEALHASTGLGRRAQWNLVADSCARLFQQAGALLGDEPRACAEGLAFVKAHGSPMRASRTGYVTLECDGHHDTLVVRGGCCLYYRVAPGANCATCPLRAEKTRAQ